MADKAHDPRTLTDDQILTERKHPRRSFLTATGAVLGAAAVLVSGAFAQEKQSDPDTKKDDKKKASGKKASKKDKSDKKESDPDKKK
jgi:hypothetical protein